MTAIHEMKIFEGYCRGGPIDGKMLRHPLNFFPMSINGIHTGQYIFAFTSDWIWLENKDGPKPVYSGILE